MLSDPTVIPLTIILLILVTLAVLENLYKVAGFLVFTYVLYIVILGIRAVPDTSVSNQSQRVQMESVIIPEEELPSAPNSEIFIDTLSLATVDTLKKRTYIPVTVNDLTMTTAILNRTPVDRETTFYDTLETVYFFTAIRNLNESPQTIVHQWQYNNSFFSAVEIRVDRSYNWRCWSKVSGINKWPGAWAVFVLDTAGNKLDSINFVIKKSIDQVSVR